MSNTKRPSRPKAYYVSGTVRYRRWHGNDDVRCYRPPKGWQAFAEVIDIHPITGKELPDSEWWIIETKE